MASEFTFLVTTDNHMGYKSDDHLRRRDSFMAFKEALQIAREKDVDFVLLGGDLFHTNKPNPAIEHKCIKILRQHMNATVDKKSVAFRRVEGHFSHFEQVKHGNFEDPSLTVPYPIMTIHGNHDDPTGPAGKSVVEKLATCGLLNYFGKAKQTHNDKSIRIEPIIFEKDSIKLALYGLGFIPDRKLRTAWDQGLVTFKEPPTDTFNIFIVHQNRRKYEENKWLPDSLLPKYFHLVIRGHEHDAMPPEIIPESNVNGIVYQPGSTVATSMEVRESLPKQVAIMRVRLNDPRGDRLTRYRLQHEIIEIKCFRKMIFRDIYQKEIFEHIKAGDSRRRLTQNEYKSIYRKYAVDCIDRLLEQAEKERQESQESVSKKEPAGENLTAESQRGSETSGSSQVSSNNHASVYNKLDRLRLPLVRVRCEFKSQIECFDDLEVNALFYPTQIANRDLIKFRKQKIVLAPDGSKKNVTFDDSNPDADLNDEEGLEVGQVEAINLQEERKDTIDTMILDYFKDKPPSERLKAISLDEYTAAVKSAGEEGNVISKQLAKKKNAVLLSYKTVLKDEHTASLHFGTEAKVHSWFMSAFRGEKPTLPPGCQDDTLVGTNNGAMGGDGGDDDDIVVWDDDFAC